ncbi:hypothetical protein Nepgr_024938 [Nepenthes gracilis]|uniref:RING-type domain-containing protein n=1 Tax=Nepenthes gracilis TaxID=150966 RepID=A0AAD3T4X9_NEPGR|nr:hypothetical protein Nepgr_024938 [Nepenthes gracilis]
MLTSNSLPSLSVPIKLKALPLLFLQHQKTLTMSPLCFIFMLLTLILLPTLIYVFFFLIKWRPSDPPCRPPTTAGATSGEVTMNEKATIAGGLEKQAIVVVKISGQEAEVEGYGTGDCPVCLSVFSDGDVLRRLSMCKHLFHACCIDKWLCSHSSCPVCRAFVASKPRKIPMVSAGYEDDDLHQGLPDSAALV